MTRGKHTGWKALCAAVAACVSAGAHASPGDGIHLGGSDARLHPFVELESRYDSNVTYSGADAVGDMILHVRPGLELNAPGNVLAVEFTGALDWAQYLGVQDSSTKDLSRFYASAGFAALLNRTGTFTPRLDDTFERSVSTASIASVTTPVVSNQNKLALSMPWRPGGGALVLTAKGEWLAQAFEQYQSTTPAGVSDLGYSQVLGGGQVEWRFLPRTSALVEANWYQRTPNTAGQADAGNGLNVLGGLTGLISERVAATAKVGWASVSADAFGTVQAAQASSVITDLAVEWLPLDSMSLRAGYLRQLGIDPLASTFVQDGVSARFQLKLADRFALHVGSEWDRFSFQTFSGYSTSFLKIDPGIDARFGRWLTAGLGYVYSARTAQVPTWYALGAPPAYSKNEAFLKVGVTY